VLEQRRSADGFEVRLVLEDEPPVGDVGERGEEVTAEAMTLVGRQQRDEQRHRHQQRADGRQQATSSTTPEAPQLQMAGPFDVGQQDAGDEETAQHEEDVDTQETALGPRQVGVIGDHGADGQGPETVEGGEVGRAPARRSLRGGGGRGAVPGGGLDSGYGAQAGQVDRRRRWVVMTERHDLGQLKQAVIARPARLRGARRRSGRHSRSSMHRVDPGDEPSPTVEPPMEAVDQNRK